jgi:hypothetical protein
MFSMEVIREPTRELQSKCWYQFAFKKSKGSIKYFAHWIIPTLPNWLKSFNVPIWGKLVSLRSTSLMLSSESYMAVWLWVTFGCTWNSCSVYVYKHVGYALPSLQQNHAQRYQTIECINWPFDKDIETNWLQFEWLLYTKQREQWTCGIALLQRTLTVV